MARIEDYALIGDMQTAALVERGGSIDWLCFPRFDSAACFAALLGNADNGRWLLAPVAGGTTSRRYLGDTLILETTWENEDGAVRVYDFMPPRDNAPDVVRIVEGVRGRVEMRSELTVRFDYGHVVPWVRRIEEQTRVAVAGPDGLCFRTPAHTRGENLRTISTFTVAEGERVPFTLTWFQSHGDLPPHIDPEQAFTDTDEFWREWIGRCEADVPDEWRAVLRRSLLVLKALIYQPTGGIVAAPTTSLPEWIGSVRNWDYRYCWLRDATLTLLALLHADFREEAQAWRTWLVRAVAGDPADIQVMYGVAGERRLTELELPWLSGYEGSAPVRIGNAASEQLQIDVFGEVIDALYQARAHGLQFQKNPWDLQVVLLEHLERIWREPDEGIWEIRGARRHFVHSKVMAWVAFDRSVRSVEEQGHPGPVERWRALRDESHAVSHVPRRRRRAAARRRRIPPVLVLARRLPRAPRPPRRRVHAVRAAARARERRRAPGGGVRPARTASAGELPAGVHAPRARQLRVQRPAAPAVADAPATRTPRVLAVAEMMGRWE